MKSFALGVVRIAAIIVLVTVTLSALGVGGTYFWEKWAEAQETARNAPLGEVKIWTPTTVEALGGVTLSLSTKWLNGTLLYKFEVDGYPPKIAAAKSGAASGSAFELLFMDKDGFKTASIDVEIHQMSTFIDLLPLERSKS